jgi:hypothetical protein
MRTLIMLLVTMTLSCAWAQRNSAAPNPVPPPQASAPPEQLEPAVDTSAVTPSAAAAASPKSDVARAQDSRDASGRKPVAQRAAAAPRAAERSSVKGPDRVELETTDITGNRELPKVLYIVPWKHSDLGDLVGKPPNSLLDEVLEPIDRDVFLRENRYYDALKPDQAAPAAGAAQGSKDKP